MKKLLLHCPQLVTDDVLNRLFTPLACAVTLLAKSVPGWFYSDVTNSGLTCTSPAASGSGCDSIVLVKN